jgi:peptidylprolyl isomerase
VPPASRLHFLLEVVSVVDTADDRLLDASATADADALRLALRDGARADATDARKGLGALHMAAGAGDGAELVAELLLRASSYGDAATMSRMVNSAAVIPKGATPLILAVRAGDELSAQILLLAHADAEAATAKGNTALSVATEKKDQPMVAVLRAAAANLNHGPPSNLDGAAVTLDGGGGVMYSITPSRCAWSGAAMRPQDLMGLGPPLCAAAQLLHAKAMARARRAARNPRVWLRLSCADGSGAEEGWRAAPRIEIELWDDVVPRTCENFRCLCTGEKGASQAFGGPPLCFKGSPIHRIVPGQILQGGDITRGDGRGGESIFGSKFADENFDGKAGRHTAKGLLSMANAGRNSNSSQFFITLDALPHLDGKHVVFGRVRSGMEHVLAIVGQAGTASGTPSHRVCVEDCGQLASPTDADDVRRTERLSGTLV